MAYLAQQKRKQIETRKIEDHVQASLGEDYWKAGGYPLFARKIGELVEEGILAPIKAWQRNGLNPPLYNGYRILKLRDKGDPDLTRELLTQYHPLLQMRAYLDQPDQYQADRVYLKLLSDYLTHREPLSTKLTVNERSFAIFNDEKFLASPRGQALLARVGLTLADLHCYPTYEPFFYYQRGIPEGQINVLIVENKDTFYSLKSLLQRGYYRWDNLAVDLLVYGEGKKILRSHSYFEELDQLPVLPTEFFYFGDLDPVGVNIWHRLSQVRPVKPFVFFYRHLLQDHFSRAPQLRTRQQVGETSLRAFLAHFAPREAQLIEELFARHCYLPQEGLHFAKLQALAAGGEER